MRLVPRNFLGFAVSMFFTLTASADWQISEQKLGQGRESDVLCVSGNIQSIDLNQVVYFISTTQDYDAQKDETLIVAQIGTALVTQQQTLTQIKPRQHDDLKDSSQAQYQRLCGEYVYQVQHGFVVGAYIERTVPGHVPMIGTQQFPANEAGLRQLEQALKVFEGMEMTGLREVSIFTSGTIVGLPASAKRLIYKSDQIDLKALTETAAWLSQKQADITESGHYYRYQKSNK